MTQAALNDGQVISQGEAAGPSQHVDMLRSELALYLRNRRPTGRLLSALATLKGLSIESIARASGLPDGLVQEIFADTGITGATASAIRRVSAVVGIDMTTMRLSGGQVHVFDLRRVEGAKAADKLRQALRGVGLLCRGAVAARISVKRSLGASLKGVEYFIVQHESFRALFVATRSRKFAMDLIPEGNWARDNSAEASVMNVPEGELAEHLRHLNLTTSEFDELIQGDSALTWADLIVAARLNGVSKADIMKHIQQRAEALDAEEIEASKAEIISPRPILTLVGSEHWSESAQTIRKYG